MGEFGDKIAHCWRPNKVLIYLGVLQEKSYRLLGNKMSITYNAPYYKIFFTGLMPGLSFSYWKNKNTARCRPFPHAWAIQSWTFQSEELVIEPLHDGGRNAYCRNVILIGSCYSFSTVLDMKITGFPIWLMVNTRAKPGLDTLLYRLDVD